MERKEIANPIIFFNGDVSEEKLRDLLQLIPKNPKAEVDIVICGSLILDADTNGTDVLEIHGNLWVSDEIVLCNYNYTEIRVDGDVYCGGNIDSMGIAVAGDFLCDADIDSMSIEIGGDAVCKGNINTNHGDFKAWGDFICYGNCKYNVVVRGLSLCEGEFDGEVIKI